MTTMFTRLEEIDRAVRNRDIRESLAAFFNMAFFTWQATLATTAVSRAGALLIVAGSAFIILWSRRAATPAAGRAPFAGDLPIVQFCRRELDRVDAQIRLLRSVWWWYLGPTTLGLELLIWGGGHTPAGFKLVMMTTIIVVAIGIYWLNVSSARRDLEPLRQELRQRVSELEREA